MDKLTVGTATCISSSLHVDAADVAVPRRIVLCVPGNYSGPQERSVRGAIGFYDAGKACELLLLSHLPLLSASSEHPTCTQQQMHFASATGSRISITSSSSSSRCRGAASAEAAPSTAAVTTKTCWLSFRWDSFLQTERKYVKCKCISVGSVFCFKATITRNRAARQMRRQLHEGPPGTTFMPDNVEIRCEFSLHICLSLSLSVYVCVKWPSVEWSYCLWQPHPACQPCRQKASQLSISRRDKCDSDSLGEIKWKFSYSSQRCDYLLNWVANVSRNIILNMSMPVLYLK